MSQPVSINRRRFAALAGATDEQYFSDPRFQFWRAAMDHIEDNEADEDDDDNESSDRE